VCVGDDGAAGRGRGAVPGQPAGVRLPRRVPATPGHQRLHHRRHQPRH